MPTYRWGINATGNIAGSMAEAMQHVPDAMLAAVSSRSQRKAQQFADRWSVPTAYDSYGALLADPSVDLIYIATPNALHKRNIVDALSAGKHVLCEKPLTTSSADTRDCIDLARRQGKFFYGGYVDSVFSNHRKSYRAHVLWRYWYAEAFDRKFYCLP